MIAALLLTLFLACGTEEVEEEPGLPIAVEGARQEALAERILTSALLEANQWQPLYFQQSGLVDRVLVAEGAPVRPNQLLAALDTDWQENQVASARQKLTSAELDLEQAVHRLEQARAMEAAGGYSPEQVYEREQQKIEAQNHVTQSEINLEGQEIRLRQMMLYAPFDGVISEVNIRVGDQVMGSVADPDKDYNQRPPMQILNAASFELRTSLPEGQALLIEMGTPAIVSLMEAPSVRMEGKVVWLAPSVDRDSRTVAFRVSVQAPEDPNQARLIRDGSTVRVELLADQRPSAITVSESAIFYHRNQSFVFLRQGDRVRQIPVEPGVLREGRVEIRQGLKAGDEVAATQVYALEDGQRVVVEE